MNIFSSSRTQLDDLLRRICSNLQLSDKQRKLAELRYHAVGTWLSDDKGFLSAAKPNIYPQGSLSIGTTVRPILLNEFDLDLVCELDLPAAEYAPNVIIDAVERRIKEHGVYRGLVRRKKSRCARLDYEGEFHLDIVPACPDQLKGNGAIRIPDRDLREWLPSNPKGYVSWFDARAKRYFVVVEAKRIEPLPPEEGGISKSVLKYVVQLIKRNRDITFNGTDEKLVPKSIVLTTLAAQLYNGEPFMSDVLDRSLRGIVSQIPRDEYIRLVVMNPVSPEEDLSDFWNQNKEAYERFKNWIRAFQREWQNLLTTEDFTQIAATLQSLFGEKITKQAVTQQAEEVQRAREFGALRVMPAVGALKIGEQGLHDGSIPVRKNTFFGD